MLSPRIRDKARISDFILFSVVVVVLLREIKQENKIKDFQVEEKEVKLPVFANDIILYVDNNKELIKKSCS